MHVKRLIYEMTGQRYECILVHRCPQICRICPGKSPNLWRVDYGKNPFPDAGSLLSHHPAVCCSVFDVNFWVCYVKEMFEIFTGIIT